MLIIKQVDFWSDITTDIHQTDTWISKYPQKLMKLQEGSHTGHKYTHITGPANARRITHNHNYTNSCALTSSIHPSRYSGDNGTPKLVPQTPEMRCVTQYPFT